MTPLVLDCRGMLCPLPIIELAKALPRAPIDSLIEVISDDAAAAVDVPAWCRMRGQEYVGAATNGDGSVTYTVRRLE